MKDTLNYIIGAIFVILFFGFGIYISIDVWQECRTTNSFFYCMRLMGR